MTNVVILYLLLSTNWWPGATEDIRALSATNSVGILTGEVWQASIKLYSNAQGRSLKSDYEMTGLTTRTNHYPYLVLTDKLSPELRAAWSNSFNGFCQTNWTYSVSNYYTASNSLTPRVEALEQALRQLKATAP